MNEFWSSKGKNCHDGWPCLQSIWPQPFYECHQLLRIPSLGFPQRNNVFIPEFRRVAIVGYVIFVIRTAFFVLLFGIPVALTRNGLWSPMCPDSKFCIAEPFRILILFK